jgi:TonB family protein
MTSKDLEGAMAKRQLLPWTIAVSFLLHGVAYASLAAAPATPSPRRAQSLVSFEISSPAKAEPVRPPEPPKPEPAPPEPARLKPRAPMPQAEPPSPPPLATTPAEQPASDGVTLAGEGPGNAFSMPLGNGGALEPARPRAPVLPMPAQVPPVAAAHAAGPVLVPVSDLSARPSPPALGAALERNYPADARQRGLSGSAKVRARIDPDGVVRHVALVEESAAGFGAACSRTLTNSRWAAPKDKAGRSVATEIRYTCRFVVAP